MHSSCTECLLCPVIGNKGTAAILVLHCAPWWSVLCLSCHGGISPDRLHAFRLRYTARLQCLSRVCRNRTDTEHTSAPASLTGLLAFLLLYQRYQQFAWSPFGHGSVHIHIHPLAVTIKQETAVWVLLCLA